MTSHKIFFDRENEYKAVSSPRYAEKEQFCSPPGGVNTVGDTIKGVQSFGAAIGWILSGERGGAEKAPGSSALAMKPLLRDNRRYVRQRQGLRQERG